MDVGDSTSEQASRVNSSVKPASPESQQPEVTALPEERDQEEPEGQQESSESGRKWSPFSIFWNEMGEGKPPTKKRKVGTDQPEVELDELEEEEPATTSHSKSGNGTRAKHSEDSQSPPVDVDSSTTLNGSTSAPAKRECTRCIRSGTSCVVGTGASCMRCRAMHQSCSLVAGRFGHEDKATESGVKPDKSESRAISGISLRRRAAASTHAAAEAEDLLDDVLNDAGNGSPLCRKRRRSDDAPTTVGSRSQSPESTHPAQRKSSPDLDEIIELAAGSAGHLGPSSSSVLTRTRRRSQNQKSHKRSNVSDNGRLNGDTELNNTRPPSRVMKALLLTSRAGRMYSEAVEELSLFVEEQRYL